jgi:hypothetical protein
MINLLSEFVSTFREWHYLSVGIMAGILAGYMLREFIGFLVSSIHGI